MADDEREPLDQPEEAVDEADTEGHSFVNPAVYSDLARQRQRDIEQDAKRAHPAKHEKTEKKRRWPFG
jgi:hypothetical protein